LANTKSAEKRNRQAIKSNARNTAVRTAVKTAVKKAREAIASGDAGKAKAAVVAATKALDTAASKGILHANNASRRVARLAHASSAKFAAAK
jgi:small subunit ribosomal protein S20